jgi:hypothetical protein
MHIVFIIKSMKTLFPHIITFFIAILGVIIINTLISNNFYTQKNKINCTINIWSINQICPIFKECYNIYDILIDSDNMTGVSYNIPLEVIGQVYTIPSAITKHPYTKFDSKCILYTSQITPLNTISLIDANTSYYPRHYILIMWIFLILLSFIL